MSTSVWGQMELSLYPLSVIKHSSVPGRWEVTGRMYSLCLWLEFFYRKVH